MGWQPEDLTAQVDGVTKLFTTTFSRDPGRVVVFFNGVQVAFDQFTEPNSKQVELAFTPDVPDKVVAVYHTDETVDGRVVGFAEDPTLGGGTTFPPSLTDILDDLDGRVDALEQASFDTPKLDAFTATAGQTVFNLPFTPILTLPIIMEIGGIGFTREGGHITVGGVDNKVVTWINTADFVLEAGERVEIHSFTLS